MDITERCDFANIVKGPLEWILSQVNGTLGIAVYAVVAGILIGLLVKLFNAPARAALLVGLVVAVFAAIMLKLMLEDPALITRMFGGCM